MTFSCDKTSLSHKLQANQEEHKDGKSFADHQDLFIVIFLTFVKVPESVLGLVGLLKPER